MVNLLYNPLTSNEKYYILMAGIRKSDDTGERSVNYNRLYYFYSVARCQNMTKAAEQLYISQPALTAQMQELEKELETVLFIRTNRGLSLTPAGCALLEEIAPFFSREKEILTRMAAFSRKVEDIRIGTVSIELIYQLVDPLICFERENPGVRARVKQLDFESLERAFEKGELELMIRTSSDAEDKRDFHSLTMGVMPLCAVMPKDHPLSGCGEIPAEALMRQKLLFFREMEPHPTDKAIRALGLDRVLRECERCSSLEILLAMVSAGKGITILSAFAPIQNRFENLTYVPLKESPLIEIAVFWHREGASPAVEALARKIAEQYVPPK